MKKFVKVAVIPLAVLLFLFVALASVSAFSSQNPSPSHSLSAFPNSTFAKIEDLDSDGYADIIVNSVEFAKWENVAKYLYVPKAITLYHMSNGVLKPKAIYNPPPMQDSQKPFGIATGNFNRANPGADIAFLEVKKMEVGLPPPGGLAKVDSLWANVLQSPSWTQLTPTSFIYTLAATEVGKRIVPTAFASGFLKNNDNLEDIVVAASEYDVNNQPVSMKFFICSLMDDSGNRNPFSDCSSRVDILNPNSPVDIITSVAVGDVGGISPGGNLFFPQDGREDIVAVSNSGRVIIFYNILTNMGGNLVSQFVKQEFKQQLVSGVADVAIGDIDNDNDNDIVVANADDDSVIAYLQEPNVPFNAGWFKRLTTKDYPSSVTISDINSDGLNDIIVTAAGTELTQVFVQNLNTGMPNAASYPLNSGGLRAFDAGAGDINNDGFNDIASIAIDNSQLSVFLQEAASGTPALGSPVQIVPRLSTVQKQVFAFNIASPYAPCTLTRDGAYIGACTDAQIATAKLCGANIYSMNFSSSSLRQKGTYAFRFNPNGVLAEQSVAVGEISVNALIDENRIVTVSTSKDVVALDDSIEYYLYRKDGCSLVQIGSGPLSQTIPGINTVFHTSFRDPACAYQSCSYLAEVLVRAGNDIGGTVVEFSYSPVIQGIIINAVSDKANYTVGENATIRAIGTDESLQLVKYSATNPPGSQLVGVNMSYDAASKWHFAVIPLNAPGQYIINITAVDRQQAWKQASTALAFTVSEPGALSAYPMSVELGTLEKSSPPVTKEVQLSNMNSQPFSSIQAVITPAELAGAGMSYVLNETTILSGQTKRLALILNPSDDAEQKEYNGFIVLNAAGMNTLSIPVHFIISNVPANDTGAVLPGLGQPTAVLEPASWSIGAIAPGATNEKFISTRVEGLGASNYVVNVMIEGNASKYLSADKETVVDVANPDAGVSIYFNAPSEERKYAASVRFEYKKNTDGTVLATKSLPVTFEVAAESSDLLSSVQSRLSRVKGKLGTVQLKAGVGTGASQEIQSLVTGAESSIKSAETSISDAKTAYDLGEADLAEIGVTSANSELDSAENKISQIEIQLSASSSETKSGGVGAVALVLIIILVIILIFGLLILALREGWLPADKFEWLKDVLEKIGLGSLVESAHDFGGPGPEQKFTPAEAKPGFAPRQPGPGMGMPPSRPATMRPGVPFRPQPVPSGAAAAPQRRPELVPEGEEPGAGEEEGQEQPKFTSYYNRRFQQ